MTTTERDDADTHLEQGWGMCTLQPNNPLEAYLPLGLKLDPDVRFMLKTAYNHMAKHADHTLTVGDALEYTRKYLKMKGLIP